MKIRNQAAAGTKRGLRCRPNRLRPGQRVVAVVDIAGFFDVAVPGETEGTVVKAGFFDSTIVQFDNGKQLEVSTCWVREVPRPDS